MEFSAQVSAVLAIRGKTQLSEKGIRERMMTERMMTEQGNIREKRRIGLGDIDLKNRAAILCIFQLSYICDSDAPIIKV